MSSQNDHHHMLSDITDSERDIKRMQSEVITIDMPDVEDIPGQEHIHVPNMKAFHDTTISSDDEEGKGLFEGNMLNSDSDVTEEEKVMLNRTGESITSIGDEDRRNLMLDTRDLDGDLLNERDDASGKDLDVPGSSDDDMNEEIGEEDEENNSYSLGGDRKD